MKHILLAFLLSAAVVFGQTKESGKIGFDEKANPENDLSAAVSKAIKLNKRILLDVGGEWCIWCHRLHEFIEADTTLKQFIDAHFVVVKVNFSKANKNEAFFSKYPKVPGYPHFFILESDGKFLHSQGTDVLEKEKSYDAGKIMEFLKAWVKS